MKPIKSLRLSNPIMLGELAQGSFHHPKFIITMSDGMIQITHNAVVYHVPLSKVETIVFLEGPVDVKPEFQASPIAKGKGIPRNPKLV